MLTLIDADELIVLTSSVLIVLGLPGRKEDIFNDKMPLLMLLIVGTLVSDEMNESIVELAGGLVITSSSLEVDEIVGKSVVDELVGRSMDTIVDEFPRSDKIGRSVDGGAVVELGGGSIIDESMDIIDERTLLPPSVVLLEAAVSTEEVEVTSGVAVGEFDSCESPDDACVDVVASLSGISGMRDTDDTASLSGISGMRDTDDTASLEVGATTLESDAPEVDGALSVGV